MLDPHQDLSPLEIEQELTRRYGEPTRRVRCIQNWMQREGLGREVGGEVGEGKAHRRVATWAEVEAFAKSKGYRLDTKGNRAGGGKAKRADVALGQQVLGLEDPAVKEAVERRVAEEVARRVRASTQLPLELQLTEIRADLDKFVAGVRGGSVSIEDAPQAIKLLSSELRQLDDHVAKIRERDGSWIARGEAMEVVDGLVEVVVSRLEQLADEVATQVRLQLSKVDGRDEEQRDRAVAEGARVAAEKVRKSIVEAVVNAEGAEGGGGRGDGEKERRAA